MRLPYYQRYHREPTEIAAGCTGVGLRGKEYLSQGRVAGQDRGITATQVRQRKRAALTPDTSGSTTY